jgi:hypothetical protein
MYRCVAIDAAYNLNDLSTVEVHDTYTPLNVPKYGKIDGVSYPLGRRPATFPRTQPAKAVCGSLTQMMNEVVHPNASPVKVLHYPRDRRAWKDQ